MIKGTYRSYTNPILLSLEQSGTARRGWCLNQNNLMMFVLNTSTLELSFASSSTQFGYLNSVYAFNGKPIPAYPSSPTSDQVFTYGTDNNLKWSDKPTTLYQHNVVIGIAGLGAEVDVVFISTTGTQATDLASVVSALNNAIQLGGKGSSPGGQKRTVYYDYDLSKYVLKTWQLDESTGLTQVSTSSANTITFMSDTVTKL